MEDKQPVEFWVRIQTPVRTRRQSRLQNPQRKLLLLRLLKHKQLLKLKTKLFWEVEKPIIGVMGELPKGFGEKMVIVVETGDRSQSSKTELQTCQAGLRQRGQQVQRDILDDE